MLHELLERSLKEKESARIWFWKYYICSLYSNAVNYAVAGLFYWNSHFALFRNENTKHHSWKKKKRGCLVSRVRTNVTLQEAWCRYHN